MASHEHHGVALDGDGWLRAAVLRRVTEGRWRAHATIHDGALVTADIYLVEAPPHATIDARAFVVHIDRDVRRAVAVNPKIIVFADLASAAVAFRDGERPTAQCDAQTPTLTVEWR